MKTTLLAAIFLCGCTTTPSSSDDASSPADLAVSTDGGGAGCSPKCEGLTPKCNATRHCVACLADTDCAPGSYCKITSDAIATCTPGCTGDDRCANAQKCCDMRCIDPQIDPKHCGGCGMACAANHSSSTCAGGQCQAGACDPGWGDCNKNAADGCESNLHSDPANCTGCGMACAIPNAFAGCSDGCYATACKFGFDDCNLNEMDGCETSVLSDPNSCGGCGKPCLALPNATANCTNGSCLLGKCNFGYANCDNMAANGCEVKVDTDAKNCGACGNACPMGNVCIQGGCTCPMCNIPNASAKCINNMCVFDKCNPGFGDCNNNTADGCEVSLLSDANHCNGCGNKCPLNTPNCVSGVCGNVDLSGVTKSFMSDGRMVHIFKTGTCAKLVNFTNYCQARGLAWWRPKSQQDAQLLITTAYNIDMFHTWIQVYGVTTGLGTVGGFNVMTDGGNCVEGSNAGWSAFRKWACSFCDPESNAMQQNNSESCCWDKSHMYDWFICEG